MKGNDATVEHLQKVLIAELTAVNQYFLHSRMFENWGLHKLAKYEYEESIDEMRHADHLIKRILFLEGLPNLQRLEKLFIGQDAPEMLRCDLKLEEIAMPLLREADRSLRKHRRLRFTNPLRSNPQGRGGARRLPRNPAPADRHDGRRELYPAAERGRRGLTIPTHPAPQPERFTQTRTRGCRSLRTQSPRPEAATRFSMVRSVPSTASLHSLPTARRRTAAMAACSSPTRRRVPRRHGRS